MIHQEHIIEVTVLQKHGAYEDDPLLWFLGRNGVQQYAGMNATWLDSTLEHY